MPGGILLTNPFSKRDGVSSPSRASLSYGSSSSKSQLLGAKVLHVAPDLNMCECTAGWWLFGLGWVFVLPWAAGAALPCVDKRQKVRQNVRRNNKRAALGSLIMLVVSMCTAVVLYFAVTACLKHGCSRPQWGPARAPAAALVAAPAPAAGASDGNAAQPASSAAQPSPEVVTSPSPAAAPSTDLASTTPAAGSLTSSPGVGTAGEAAESAPTQPLDVESPAATVSTIPGSMEGQGAAGSGPGPAAAVPKPATAVPQPAAAVAVPAPVVTTPRQQPSSGAAATGATQVAGNRESGGPGAALPLSTGATVTEVQPSGSGSSTSSSTNTTSSSGSSATSVEPAGGSNSTSTNVPTGEEP